MAGKKKEQTVAGGQADSGALEEFMDSYLGAYRDRVIGKDIDERHLPQFFKAHPFVIDIYRMPNGSVCVLFKKGSRQKISILDAGFDTVRSRLAEQDLDFMLVFPPFTRFTSEEAARLAKLDADRDMRQARRLEILTAAESHISGMHEDIRQVVELNPWLDQQTEGQKRKLDEARKLIQGLYSEVEVSREERFAEYSDRLADAMSFERGEMEQVAGEMALELETAVEEMDGRLSAL